MTETLKYEVVRVESRPKDNKLYCIMFIKVDTQKIKGDTISIEFECTSGFKPQEFIQKKIKERLKQIQKVELLKQNHDNEIIKLRNQYVGQKGMINLEDDND